MSHDVAVFVASSDNTEDVLQQVFPSVRRFWPDCPFPIFVGKNTPRLTPEGCRGVYAPASDWRTELLGQLDQLDVSRVLLLLDDFLLTAPIDSARIFQVVDEAVRKNHAYLRLKVLRRAFLPMIVRNVQSGIRHELVERIPVSMPYYSGLQPALWTVDHLRACLHVAGDIWSFEHVIDEATPHFAVRSDLVHCIHVVERGRWLPAAERLFEQAGLPFDRGRRESWSRRTQGRIWFGALRFALCGYAGVRLRRLAARAGVPGFRSAAQVGRTIATAKKCSSAG